MYLIHVDKTRIQWTLNLISRQTSHNPFPGVEERVVANTLGFEVALGRRARSVREETGKAPSLPRLLMWP